MEKHYGVIKKLMCIYTNKEENDEMKFYKIENKKFPEIKYNNQIYRNIDDIPNKEKFINEKGSKNDTLPETEETKIERLNNARLKYYIIEALKLCKYEVIDFRFCKDKDLQIQGADIIILVRDKGKKFFVCVDAKTTIKHINRCNLYLELFQNCQKDIWQRGSALTKGICKHHYLCFSDEYNCYLITKNRHNIGVLQDAAVLHKHRFVAKDKDVTHQKRNDKYCMIIGEEINKESFDKLDKLVFKRFVEYVDYETKEIKYRLAKVSDNTNSINDRLKAISEKIEIVMSEKYYNYLYNENDTIENLVYKLILNDMLLNEESYLYQYVEDCIYNKEVWNNAKCFDTENLAKYFVKKLINTYLRHSSNSSK